MSLKMRLQMLKNRKNSDFNPAQSTFVLKEGEPFYDTDNGTVYVGDGTSTIAQLYNAGNIFCNLSALENVSGTQGLTFGNYDDKERTCAVTGYSGSSSTVELPSYVLHNGKVFKVESVGSGAFANNSTIAAIVLHDGITSIGATAFDGCSNLGSITLGSGIEDIGEYAFRGCSRLTRTYYRGSIATWCAISFSSNDSNPVYHSHNLYINNVDKLSGQLVIPKEVEYISPFAFYNANGLTTIYLRPATIEIGSYAFKDCTGLRNVLRQDSDHTILTHIDPNAFEGCTSLQRFTIQRGVSSMGAGAFLGCTNLQEITLGEGVVNIDNRAFDGCSALTSITIPGSVKSMSLTAFTGSSLDTITINNYEGSILGAPWGATNATITYVPEERYVRVAQTAEFSQTAEYLNNNPWYEAKITPGTDSSSTSFKADTDSLPIEDQDLLFKIVYQTTSGAGLNASAFCIINTTKDAVVTTIYSPSIIFESMSPSSSIIVSIALIPNGVAEGNPLNLHVARTIVSSDLSLSIEYLGNSSTININRFKVYYKRITSPVVASNSSSNQSGGSSLPGDTPTLET